MGSVAKVVKYEGRRPESIRFRGSTYRYERAFESQHEASLRAERIRENLERGAVVVRLEPPSGGRRFAVYSDKSLEDSLSFDFSDLA